MSFHGFPCVLLEKCALLLWERISSVSDTLTSLCVLLTSALHNDRYEVQVFRFFYPWADLQPAVGNIVTDSLVEDYELYPGFPKMYHVNVFSAADFPGRLSSGFGEPSVVFCFSCFFVHSCSIVVQLLAIASSRESTDDDMLPRVCVRVVGSVWV